MAQLNPLTRELLVKLVYYGPGLCGKTTSLQRIHSASPPETRGQIVSLATPVDRTLYFDFLPLRAQTLRGHHVRLQLFTVPGQVYFNATRKLVLTGADGVVFVADSQRERLDANLESLENLATNLEDQGRSLAEIPLVFQYNKRDLPSSMARAELDEALNALGVPAFETNASKGEGVLDALDALVRKVLDDLEAKNAFGAQNPPAEPRFARAEMALEEQIGRASEQLWRPSVDAAVKSARNSEGILPPSDREPATRAVSVPVPKPAPLPTPVPPAPGELVSKPSRTPGGVIPRDTLRPTLFPETPNLATPAARSTGPSWVRLFPDEADEILSLEAELAEGRLAEAILRCEVLANRLLVHVGQQAGVPEPARDPSLLAPLLGLSGERWLAFRRLSRRARAGGPLDERDALEAYGLLIELRLRRERLFV